MALQDAQSIKDKIVSFIRIRGPSIPVQIAQEIGLTILFTSAFLSELYSEKIIKMSHMRVGSSPIYYIDSQEPQLEKFSQHLKSKEKEAFLLLKEKKFLKDEEQEPAIRVALRSIKDFAFPFKRNEEVYWRYFIVPQEEFIKEPVKEIIPEIKEKKLDIFDSEKELDKIKAEIEEKLRKEILSTKQPKKRKTVKKSKNEKINVFIEEIKKILDNKGIKIVRNESSNNKEALILVSDNEKEYLLAAYNKKKITEKDILKAHKKAVVLNLPYAIISKGEIPKKIKENIDAYKNLNKVETI